MTSKKVRKRKKKNQTTLIFAGMMLAIVCFGTQGCRSWFDRPPRESAVDQELAKTSPPRTPNGVTTPEEPQPGFAQEPQGT